MNETLTTVMGFLTGLTILGGAITAVGGYFLKNHFKTAEENEELKHRAVRDDIEKATQGLRVLIERQSGDFRALEARVSTTLKEMERIFQENSQRYSSSVDSMRAIIAKAEARFEVFQKELNDVHVFIERIRQTAKNRAAGGNKKDE